MSRSRERQVVFPWERRGPAMTWLSRRRAGLVLRVLSAGLGIWALVAVEDHRRRVFATRAAIRSVMSAAEAFRADHGRCPATVDELAHPPEVPGGTSGYLTDVRLDGWGNGFRLTCPGWKHPGSVDVVSGGPTGTFLDLDQVE